jgi:hypothetical protein
MRFVLIIAVVSFVLALGLGTVMKALMGKMSRGSSHKNKD